MGTMKLKSKWDRLTTPYKTLIRSLAISWAGYFLLPDGPWIWLVLGNEGIKMYRFWQEGKALDREMEEALKKAEEYFTNRNKQFTLQNCSPN